MNASVSEATGFVYRDNNFLLTISTKSMLIYETFRVNALHFYFQQKSGRANRNFS